MDFGELLSQSWNEYKLNFKVIFKLFLYFVIIPGIVLLLLDIYGISSLDILSLDIEKNPFILFQEYPGYAVSILVLSLLAGFISFFGYLAVTCGALKGKKFSYSEALKEAKKNYWRAIGYTIVVAIFLILLSLLFIIPGIIFSVYWIFSYYIFLNEKKGIIESLKASKHMVNGKWWMTLGYVILIMLVVIFISMIFSIPSFISGFAYALSGGAIESLSSFIVFQVIGFIFSSAGQLITTPLMILFIKNFYLSTRKSK